MLNPEKSILLSALVALLFILTGAAGTFAPETREGADAGASAGTPAQGAPGASRFGELVSGEVVAVQLYNTTSDAYSGVWQSGAGTSWSSQGPFPKVTCIMATPTDLYIYNATDETEWMRFTGAVDNAIGAQITCFQAADGVIAVGTADGLYIVDFDNDAIYMNNGTGASNYTGDIMTRNSGSGFSTWHTVPGIVSSNILDVHTAVHVAGSGKQYVAAGTPDGLAVIDIGTSANRAFVPVNITPGNDHRVTAVHLCQDGTLYQAGEKGGTQDVYLAALFDVSSATDALVSDGKGSGWDAYYSNVGGGDPQATTPYLEPQIKLYNIYDIDVTEGMGGGSGDNLVLVGTDIGFNVISEDRGSRTTATQSGEDVVSFSTGTTTSVVDFETVMGDSETVSGLALDQDREIIFAGSGEGVTAGAITLIDLATGATLDHFDTGTDPALPHGNVTSVSADVGILLVGSPSGGTLLDVNQPPSLVGAGIPVDTFEVEEDSGEWMTPVDLTPYFTDDYDPTGLNFTLAYEEDDTVVDGKVVDDVYFTAMPVSQDFFGQMSFRVRVKDTGGKFVESANFTVTVAPTNDPPEFDQIGIFSHSPGLNYSFEATEGELFEMTVTAKAEPDGDTVTFGTSLTAAQYPDFIDPVHGNISFTPGNDDVGYLNFTVSVNDGNGSSVKANVSIHVANANSKPHIIEFATPKEGDKVPGVDEMAFEAKQGTLWNATVTGSDPDLTIGEDDQLTYTVSLVTFTPLENQDASIAEFVTTPSTPTFTVVQVDERTSWVQFMPDNGHVGGRIDLTLEVRDAADALVDDSANFTVTVSNSNDAPVLKRITPEGTTSTNIDVGSAPTVSVTEDVTINLTLVVFDPDHAVGFDDDLTFSAKEAPDEAAIASLTVYAGTGIVKLTPDNDDVGTHEYIFTVKDQYGDSDDASVIIDVINVNDPPEPATITSPDTGSRYTTLDVTFGMENATDVDTDASALTYYWDFDDSDGIQADSTERAPTHTFPPGIADYNVTLVVSDGQYETTTSITILIREDTSDPADGGDTNDTTDEEGGNATMLIIIILVVVVMVALIAAVAGINRGKAKRREADQREREEKAAMKAEEEVAAQLAGAAAPGLPAADGAAALPAGAGEAPALPPGTPGAAKAAAAPAEAIDIPEDILGDAAPDAVAAAAAPEPAAPENRCPACAALLPEGAATCPECGSSLGAVEGEEEEMFQCGACGQLIPATSTVCPQCGASFEEAGEEMSQCGACGQVIPADASTCPHCGASFTEPGAEVPMAAPVEDMPPIEDAAAGILAGAGAPAAPPPAAPPPAAAPPAAEAPPGPPPAVGVPPPADDLGDMFAPISDGAAAPPPPAGPPPAGPPPAAPPPEAAAPPPPPPAAAPPADDLGDMFAPISDEAEGEKKEKKKDDEFGDLFGTI